MTSVSNANHSMAFSMGIIMKTPVTVLKTSQASNPVNITLISLLAINFFFHHQSLVFTMSSMGFHQRNFKILMPLLNGSLTISNFI